MACVCVSHLDVADQVECPPSLPELHKDRLDSKLREQQQLLEFAMEDSQLRGEDQAPRQALYQQVAGFGRAPWEIHRPQKALIALAKKGVLRGKLLDMGCGIGDNALFLARYSKCTVTSVDVVPRCIEFCKLKAGLREAVSVNWVVANLLQEIDTTPLAHMAFDVLLDSMTFHCFNDRDRDAYMKSLTRLCHPGTTLYLMCVSDKELRQGGPRRISESEIRSVFNQASKWQVHSVEDITLELHPNVLGGHMSGYLATIERLA